VSAEAPFAGSVPAQAAPSQPVPELSLADGVALVRQVLAEASTPPRWPMYLRQMKQFIRSARPDFDERRYGSLPDLLRACQKDGLLRLERDRQGGLRAFAGSYRASSVPHGWGSLAALPQADVEFDETQPVVATEEVAQPPAPAPDAYEPSVIEASGAPEMPSGVEAGDPPDDQLAMFGVVGPGDPEPVAVRRARKTKKTDGTGRGGGDKAAAKRPRRAPATRTRSRRNPS
jgi:hypothetical protein